MMDMRALTGMFTTVSQALPPVAWLAIAASLLGALLLVVALRKRRGSDRCVHCDRVMMPDWAICLFCQTPRGLLEFLSGSLSGRTIALRPTVTIGSGPDAMVSIKDEGVSRKHAGVRLANGRYALSDLGSTNGVFINGERVANRRLVVGDVIRLGTTEMIFKA